MRIVSLLPSATEIVCALGLREQLVGVTHECDYPPCVLDLPKVTRTLIPHDASSRDIDELVRDRLQTHKALYALDMETLAQLRPELIVTQALCDVCAVAAAEVNAAAQVLPSRPRVLNLEPMSLSDVFDTLKLVGPGDWPRSPGGCRRRRTAGTGSGGHRTHAAGSRTAARRSSGVDRSALQRRSLDARADRVCGRRGLPGQPGTTLPQPAMVRDRGSATRCADSGLMRVRHRAHPGRHAHPGETVRLDLPAGRAP